MNRMILAATAGFLIGAVPAMGQEHKWPQPDVEAWTLRTLGDAAAKFRAAANDMAKGLTRHNRELALCDQKGPLWATKGKAVGWIGRITKLDAVSDGRGILEVQIAPLVTLRTTNNTFGEKLGEPKTLIDVGSPLYSAVVNLPVNQAVRFSGTFFPSGDDCIKETSLTAEGSMTEPDFLFRFTEVTPLD